MGVVRNRVVVTYPEENGSPPTDVPQSPSDAESSDNEPIEPIILHRRRQRNRGGKVSYYDESSASRSNTGKRKIRRHANDKTLQIYLKDDDTDPDNLLEAYKDPFARLMDITNEPLEFLNNFTCCLEQESMVDPQAMKEKSELSPYYRISNKIRRSIKIRRNFPICLIKTIEGDVVEFFKINPQDIFCCVPSKSFERLLFHAVAQYHGLRSISLAKNGHICVEVFNEDEEWIPVEVKLTEYIIRENIVS